MAADEFHHPFQRAVLAEAYAREQCTQCTDGITIRRSSIRSLPPEGVPKAIYPPARAVLGQRRATVAPRAGRIRRKGDKLPVLVSEAISVYADR